MPSDRRPGGGTQWAIATAATGLGVLATLVATNAINHAGWSPSPVAIGWIAIVALATMLIKLRHSSFRGLGPGAPGNHWPGTAGGDGISGGGGG
jgi:hypothetical protein